MPIVQHDGKKSTVINMDELYQGVDPAEGETLHIPAIGDLVVDFNRGFFKVDAVDPITKIPTLSPWKPETLGDSGNSDDINAGLTRNFTSGANRAFVNYNVSPPTINIDRRVLIMDAAATTVKIFKGTDTSSATGTVISRVYDNNQNFISENVELERVFPENDVIKYVPETHIDTGLNQGEIVTVVAYSANSGVVHEEHFTTRLTDAIGTPDLNNKYLVGISLVSDLVSAEDPEMILNDLNVPFNTTLMQCRLHYNDGSHVDIGIDGMKAKLMGIDNFNESTLGPANDILLVYYPSADEPAINVVDGENPVLTKSYKLSNQRGEATFGFKLYVIPKYQDISLGYTLEYRLTNFDYDIDVDVTANVTTTLRSDGSAWSPTNYGNRQELLAVLRLEDVMPGIYDGWIHTQNFNITLDVPTDGAGNSWVIDYAADNSRLLGYDVDIEASNINSRVLIQNGHVNQADWLDKLYYEAVPLFDQDLISAPPRPTHFRFTYGEPAISKVFGIDEWDKYLSRDTADPYTAHETATITWLLEDGPSTFTLGHTPLLVRIVD